MFTSQSNLCCQAQDALRHSPLYVLRQLEVEEVNDRLMISGRVKTFYQKQQAQELVRAVAQGMTVQNSVEVVK